MIMLVRSSTASVRWVCSLALFVGASLPAHAGDGVIEINQAKAEAGGVSTGDAKGFPVTISESGSYRLTGNLVVPDENTTAIDITAELFTLDLNGFAIIGPVTCGPNFPTDNCGPVGSGIGIKTAVARGTIRNGYIRGMGAEGINSVGNLRIDEVRVRNNAGTGILATGTLTNCESVQNGGHGFNGGGSISSSSAAGNVLNGIYWGTGLVVGSTARLNTGDGIVLFIGNVRGNLAESNHGDGIEIGDTNDGSLVEGNTVDRNFELGLRLGGAVGYVGNVIFGNTGGTVTGGIEIGTNRCNTDTTCP